MDHYGVSGWWIVSGLGMTISCSVGTLADLNSSNLAHSKKATLLSSVGSCSSALPTSTLKENSIEI